jgi:hypothetical protein
VTKLLLSLQFAASTISARNAQLRDGRAVPAGWEILDVRHSNFLNSSGVKPALEPSHRDRVHRVVPWDRYKTHAVRHNDVFSFSDNPKADLLKRSNRPEMRHTGNAGQLDRNLDLPDLTIAYRFPYSSQIFLNSRLDVLKSLLFGISLGPTTWQARTTNAKALFGALQYHGIFHARHPCV